ncbi:MAG: glycosyltransferase family 39 protein [Polyangiaceae bacterium]|nr:glycosyltransferase family 39 protein [Polyangiaceae bacterium]
MPSTTAAMSLDKLTRIALVVSVVLLGLRLTTAEVIGFGDAEALYATYALFGQATYLDHPGLLGWVGATLAGASGVPSPVTVHRWTAVAATSIPWLAGLAARGAGAPWRGVLCLVLAMSLVPELAVGLFAFAPDVPLAVFWLGALGSAAVALRAEAGSARALAGTLAAGMCTALACLSKVSGVLLGLGLLATWLSKPVRPRLRTVAPYAALLAGLMVVVPALRREGSLGFPMLHHRLLNSQAGFGPSLRNLGGLVGGQLLYLTPVVAVVVVLIAIDLARRFRDDAVSRLLFFTTFIPFGVLAALTVLSRVAEPHWVAPAYLALGIHFARRTDQATALVSRKWGRAALVTSAVGVALVFAVVHFPVIPKVLGARYKPKYDLVNDLYAWQTAAPVVRQAVHNVQRAGIFDVSVVGPHWVICAQVQAALGREARVGCQTPQGDDFGTAYPESRWQKSPVIVYVTDDRFDVDVSKRFPDRALQSVDRVGVRRGGQLVRTIRVMVLGRAARV